jgi:hypothetical protein
MHYGLRMGMMRCSDILHHSCPERIEVDVCDKLFEIRIFLAENRFVTVLEEMSISAMSPIEPDRVTGQQAAHDPRDWNGSGAEKQMRMIGHECPRITLGLRLFQKNGYSLNEIFAVLIIHEDPFSLDSSGDDVMQRPRGVDAGLTWHER